MKLRNTKNLIRPLHAIFKECATKVQSAIGANLNFQKLKFDRVRVQIRFQLFTKHALIVILDVTVPQVCFKHPLQTVPYKTIHLQHDVK